MAKYRFKVGTNVMCNLGQHGWRLGRIIALDYREPSWPQEDVAPYQVALVDDFSLIYVPQDDDRFCRAATSEDVKILARKDALAELKFEGNLVNETPNQSSHNIGLTRPSNSQEFDYQSYRKGRCFCCNDNPSDWLYAELYSEHYRCASRNGIKVTHHKAELDTVNVGDSLNYYPDLSIPVKTGFMQAPTLPRLPPGILFTDDGSLTGQIGYDPHRSSTYTVQFVAVSTAAWDDDSVGIVRLEINFTVTDNNPPSDFDVKEFEDNQKLARKKAAEHITNLNQTWIEWESRSITNQATCERMLTDLAQLRELLLLHPRLDNGKWWGQLGGYHMNVHKLLENTLFECELYLGYALAFGDNDVRFYAEQNLKGCYQKRLLEAARFMWYDGIQLMLQHEWNAAIEIFRAAYGKKEGWGWAVNYGDIWLSEAVALIIDGVSTAENASLENQDWFISANHLLQLAQQRANDSGVFGQDGHPWITAVVSSLESLKELIAQGNNTTQWLEEFNSITVYWCSQILAGVFPFPPITKVRHVAEIDLVNELPKYNQ